jgi:hypothetical protein
VTGDQLALQYESSLVDDLAEWWYAGWHCGDPILSDGGPAGESHGQLAHAGCAGASAPASYDAESHTQPIEVQNARRTSTGPMDVQASSRRRM